MSFWGKLGKIALKAAPIAASFIPGVGPLAAMAISGGAGAASKKLEGGSWKQALGAGAMGAGTSALGSALSGAKLKDMGKFTAAKGAALTGGQKLAKGISAGLGGLGVAQDIMSQRASSPNTGGGIGPSVPPTISSGSRGGRDYNMPNRFTDRGMNFRNYDNTRGLPYGIGAGQTPDLAGAFARGRNMALQNQIGMRQGQDPFTRTNPDTGEIEEVPGGGLAPIYPQYQQQPQRRMGRGY
jgi:hypothetical protein